MIETLTQFNAKELLLNSAILAVVFRGVWGMFSEVTNRMRQFFAKRTQVYEVDLGQYHPEFDKVINFYCLVVRYGTDAYLQCLASDRDRFDGRLQNRVLPIAVEKDKEENARFVLDLPVHQRIGTQFKCFAEVKSEEELEIANKALSACVRVHEVSKSSSQFKYRIYFLLRDFGTTKSIDGIENNICFPV